jgi:hypothetical protein
LTENTLEEGKNVLLAALESGYQKLADSDTEEDKVERRALRTRKPNRFNED